MVKINALQRRFLEEIGIIKPRNISYKWLDEMGQPRTVSQSNGMTICNVNSCSKAKSIYVEDSFVAFIDPEWYRRISEKYFSKSTIENQIRHAKWYLERYRKSKEDREKESKKN